MYIFYFSCSFEEIRRRMRVLVYENDFLYLYEVEPEDRQLSDRFGVKFFTQQRADFLDIRCHHPIREHNEYESVVLMALQSHLLSNRILG
ncbi:MAG TPA: hypothetical protein VHE54_16775 [Puia sp.]|nr:hypothetical protein [Puia sp.]